MHPLSRSVSHDVYFSGERHRRICCGSRLYAVRAWGGALIAPRVCIAESPFPTLSKSSYSSCEGTSSQLQDFSQESPCNHRFLRSRASPVATRTAPQKQPTAKMIAPITICIRTPPQKFSIACPASSSHHFPMLIICVGSIAARLPPPRPEQ